MRQVFRVADPSREPLGRRAQNTLRNREQILRAALASFSELGFGASTVRDIMGRSGLASGTFYNYFDGKDELLREIVVRFSTRLRQQVREARLGAKTLDDLVRSAFRATFTFFARERLLVSMLARNAGEVHELVAASVMDPAIRDLAEDLEARAVEFGIVGVDLDAFALAGVALGHQFGHRLIGERRPDIEATTELVTDLVLGGLERAARRARPGTRRRKESAR